LAERSAAELAIGDRVQADTLLHSGDLADQPVLDPAQIGGGQPALKMRLARLAQLLRADQAADVVGAKRRLRALWHGWSPCRPWKAPGRCRCASGTLGEHIGMNSPSAAPSCTPSGERPETITAVQNALQSCGPTVHDGRQSEDPHPEGSRV